MVPPPRSYRQLARAPVDQDARPHRRLLPGFCQRPVRRGVRPLHSQRRDLLPLAASRVRLARAREYGNILLAIRFYLEPIVLVSGSTGDSGGMHQAPILGLRSQIESIQGQEITGRVLTLIVPVCVTFLMLISAAAAFRIWLLDLPAQRTLAHPRPYHLRCHSRDCGCRLQLLRAHPGRRKLLVPDRQDSQLPLLDRVLAGKWFQLERDRRLDLLMILLTTIITAVQAFAWLPAHNSAARSLLFLEISTVSP